METDLGNATERLLDWLNNVQDLGTLLVLGGYLRKAIDEYEKLPQDRKERTDRNSFLVGFILASWGIEFPKRAIT